MATKPARKVKETPKNLEWNSTSKSLGMWKTSLMQRVGGAEGKLVPTEFTEASNKVKLLKDLLKELVERAKTYSKSILAYSQSGTSWGATMAEFAAILPSDDVVAPALAKFQEVQNDIEQSRLAFKEVLLNTLATSIEKFQQDEINQFRDLKHMWSKSRLEYDAAKLKLDETLKAKQTEADALRYLRAHLHYAHARKREALKFEAALDKVGDVLWKRDFALLQETIVCMQALAKFVESSFQTLGQLDDYFAQLRDHTALRRNEWKAFKEQKKEEKRQLEINEYNARYTPLVELLSNEDLALVNAVCVTAGSEQEFILESLIHILDAHKMTLPIIKLGITREVEKTKNAATLFRGNTMATKLMTAFTRMTGRQYLTATLKPLLEGLVAQINNGTSFEVDPEKEPNNAANLENLKAASQKFLDAIVSSTNICPVPFKVMACHLKEEVVRSYPEAKYIAVGGFIFLRFFCPAILSPETSSPPLLSSVDAKVRRALILISKCLQNLANGIEFGIKEPFMEPVNQFIKDNDARVKAFFDELSSPPPSEEYEPLCGIDVAISKELPSLHGKIVQNLSKIGTSLTQYKQEETIPALALILAELGEEGLNLPTPEKKKDKKK